MTIERDVDYAVGQTHMRGLLVAPDDAKSAPTVLLIHDAFGLGEDMIAIARDIATLGYTVFAADVWGDRITPGSQPEIGPLIGAMVGDRPQWHARLTEAQRVAAAQPEVDADRIVLLGYCFGGSSALEFLRTGGQALGALAIHPGLDLIEFDWAGARTGAQVHIELGADDPMATAEQCAQLQDALDGAGIDWQLNLYGKTVHAFTSRKAQDSPAPHVFDYHPRNARRAWESTTRFLAETLGA